MSLFITRCVGIITSAAARSVYSRLPYFNPVMKSIAARIHPGAATAGSVYQRFPYSNSVVKSIAARSYLTGRTLLDAAYRTIKSWVPKMSVSWSATYANAAAARSYRFPYSNLVVKSIAAHSDPIGRTFCRQRKPRVSRMPVFWSFTYVNVEKIEGQKKKIERIVYPFLFRVTGKDISSDQKVYLLGMDHSFKEADYPPEALALIKACGLLLSEFPAQMALSKNPEEWNLHEVINTYLHIHKKLLSVDKEWIGTFFSEYSAYETAVGKMSMDTLASKLKEKSGEIKADQARWLDRLSLADQIKIQTRLDQCGLQLSDLDPVSVSLCLYAINEALSNHYDSNAGEIAIIKNFQERNCPIIELENELSDLANLFDGRIGDILDYDLESAIEDMFLQLEPQVEEIDELQQTLQKLQKTVKKHGPYAICEGDGDNEKCVEFKTARAFKSHLSLIQKASRLGLLRSTLDKKIYFNFDDYEEKELVADPSATDWSIIYRNNTWYPKIPLAIKQKKDAAIICGNTHLIGETGMVRSLRRDGYHVEPVKFLKK